MKAIASQRKQLYRLFGYCKETETVQVQRITGDTEKKTVSDLTISQAKSLIDSLTTNWAVFDKGKKSHSYILSLLWQLNWTKPHHRYGNVADMSKLSDFLKSKRSPVVKPLQEMTTEETSKIINALENIIKWSYKTKNATTQTNQ